MQNDSHSVGSRYGIGQGSLVSYIIGFMLSLLLTGSAYYLVVEHVFTGWMLACVISSLGMLQVFVQLVFFLHLGSESKPYWNLLVFLFMLLVLLIIVTGSLWIMHNLDSRMMPTSEAMDAYMFRQDGQEGMKK